jgi:predicted phage tail protein
MSATKINTDPIESSSAIVLRGSGGGGGGKDGGGQQRTPTTAPDSLESTQYALLVDLISEGEIQGLKEGHRSIYINNTPLANAGISATYAQSGTTITVTKASHGITVGTDLYISFSSGLASTGIYTVATAATNTFTVTAVTSQTTSGNAAYSTYNFRNVTVFTRNGTQTQDYIPVTADISSETAVGVTVQKAVPVVRSITDTTVNAVRITITVPSLQLITDEGDIHGASVELKISVQYNGGSYTDVTTDTITGRTSDQYQRDYLIDLTGAFPVDIKVTRVTNDSSNPKLSNAFSWSSYTELTYAKLKYPNSGLVAMRVDAEQFSNIPERTYLIRGIKIAIPSNATVNSTNGSLTYSGIWDGTFGAAQWCSDPAWILFDFLTAKRYGFGDHISASQLDKWAFYAASQYCSGSVPTGIGAATEPRFSCNVNIQTAQEAYKLINDLCSVFRAMPFWSTGALTVSQDKPTTPSFLFTLANIGEDGFTYSNSSQKTRPTVAVVSYLNLDTRDTAYEVVEDQDAVARYGVVTSQIEAFACTSRGQAHRVGKWLLYTEQQEGEVITFTTSLDAGVIVRPGQIINVSDPMRAGVRRGGRISSATTTVITLDDTTGLTMAGAPTISVILPTGVVETRSVSAVTGNTITVSSAFSVAPNSNSIWTYQTNDLVTSTWRVLTVAEQDDCIYQVSALSYNSSKYDYIENNSTLQTFNTSNLNAIPAAPTNLTFTEALYTYQSQVRAKVLASWKPVVGINIYEVRWRKDNNNWTVIQQPSCDFEVLDITPGVFEFKVYSINAALKPSTTALTGSITALGKTAPPAGVSSLVYTVDGTLGVTLSWADVADLDLDTYEIRRGTAWGSASYVTQTKSTSFKIGYLDDGTYTYLVKAIDTSQVYSTNAASVAVTISSPPATTITQTISGTDLVLSWTIPAVTSYAIDYYRVTYGNTYATSAQLTRSQTTSFTVPITWTGSRTFYVAPVDKVGKFTDPPASTTVTITGAAAPTITTAVGGNTATLSWTAVSGTLPTAGYEVRQGGTFSTATVLANITGTTYTLKATWSGSQTFWVVARDANGTYGTQASAVITVNAAGAPTLSASFAGQNTIFAWNAIKGTLDTDFYTLKRGASWAAATTIATIYSTAYTLKADWGGSATFWLAAVDINGTEGTPVSLGVTVTVPTAPALSQQVIDNNVLLRWNDVTQTLPIVYYELRKGSTWAAATVIGTKQGGFTTVFETASGSYTYWLAGVDSAGNYGTPGSVTAQVNQPPDYVLKLNQSSTWTGTKTNIITAETGQLVNVNTTETWQSHFTSRSWTTPQDQINAGYPYFMMPSTTTASYEESYDYGTVLAGTKITATLTSSVVAGSTTITPTVSVRQLITDPWTNYAGLSEVYATSFRYFKVKYDFTSTGGDDLLLLTALNVRLDSKLRNDSGSGTANSADSGGTTVNFNITFVDVDSISVTPLTTSAVIAVYDFTDVPNPTSFKVLLFNTSGTRVSGGFSWSARGV